MSWRIDVLDGSSYVIGPTLTGSGPITSATSWQSTARMDRAGTFSFEMPASDGKASLIQPLNIARCYAQVAGAWTEVGAGIIEHIETAIDGDGQAILRVSGSDMVGELAIFNTEAFYVDGSNSITEPMPPVSHADAVNALYLLSYPPDWTMIPDPAPPVDDLVGRWNYESVLQAVITLAAKCQTHFYLSAFRELTFASTATDSGIRATNAASGGPVAAIGSVRRIEDGADIVTEIIPFGAGNADARLTMIPHTRTVPAGFTTSATPNGWWMSLSEDAPYTQYGPRRRVLQWKDISPISSTDADVQAAANALFDQAYRYLVQHNRPAEFYELSLLECPALLRPLQTIRVVYRDPAQNVDIDADLLILEVTTEVEADGPRTTGLVVSTVDRWPESDAGTVVQRLTQAQLYEVAPQLNANSYVISYNKPVDDAETASFRFRFDSEVVQLTRLTFDFQLLPLESTVTAVGGATSGSGILATTVPSTNASGNPSNNTSGTATGNTGAATGNTGAATGNTGAATGDTGGSGTLTTNSPSGGDTISSGRHQHTVGITLGATVTYPIGYGAAGTAGGLVSTAPGSTHNYPTNQSGDHSHGLNNHVHTLNSHAHGLNSHTHDLGSHTHSLNNHTHDLGNHTHSLNNHTHDLSESITAIYGIFRDSAGNTFGLTDLEYSVDGSTWYAFSVGVNGFASLGDGWYRVDLTSLLQNSTTLRPTANNNAVQVRRKSTGAIKKAMIEAQINVRTIIQAIAAL